MRTSTKVLISFFIISLVGVILSFAFLISAVSLAPDGIKVNMTTMSWIAFGILSVFLIIGFVLYIRFLRHQRFSMMLFFGTMPFSLLFGGLIYFVATIDTYKNNTVVLIKQTLKITEVYYNTYIWIGLFTIIYLFIMFVIYKSFTKPIKRMSRAVVRLSDGQFNEKISIGGGKQFSDIEYALNKINDNYKNKDKLLSATTTEYEKSVPKQFVKFLGKNNINELEVGSKIQKIVTTLFCDIRQSSGVNASLSLEENFNYINSYMNVVSPIIRKFGGFVDKFTEGGIFAIFAKANIAVNCSVAILKAVKDTNLQNKTLPNLDVGIALNTGEVVIGIMGDEMRRTPTIISENISVANKMEDINKKFGSVIIFSNNTLNDLENSFDINYRYIGRIFENSNVNEPISVFEMLDIYPKTKKDKMKKCKTLFEQGVKDYENGKFEEARPAFEKVYKTIKDDRVCYTYFNLCEQKLRGIAD